MTVEKISLLLPLQLAQVVCMQLRIYIVEFLTHATPTAQSVQFSLFYEVFQENTA